MILSRGSYNFILRHKTEIEKLNYYSWARFLEKINDDTVTTRLLDKLELSTPRRGDLSIYRDVLINDYQKNSCFYCGKKLGNKSHVDHFIPWSYIKSDNLWNFVLACPRCNSIKKNQLMSEEYVKRINEQNTTILESVNNSAFVESEFRNYYPGLIEKIWKYAKLSGIKECNKKLP